MENYQFIGWLIQIVATVLYLGYCLIKFGLTDTISATWYEHKSWIGKWAFTIWLYCIIFPVFLFFTGIWQNLFLFAACIFIGWVATYPNYKEDWAEGKHIWGAILGIVFAMLGIWFSWGLWWIAAGVAVISGLSWLVKLKGATYIAEFAAIVAIILAEKLSV